MQYEYKVVPAPTRGKRVRGLKTLADRFANTLSQSMNAEAAEGWEYLRTDTLPSEVRNGLTGRSTVFQNMLVFRRAIEVDVEAQAEESPGVDVSAIADVHAPKLAGVSRKAGDPSVDAPQVRGDADHKPAGRRKVAAE